ncbi:MAG: tetratricopeptide repeat protein [Akkermansia sp.]|nr:tetratricopeptide repeat protein [Akkermansia sp.]
MDNHKNDEDIMPLSPEEIKAIGEIELGPSKHEQFLNDHYKKLLWGGIALGIAAGCTIAYFSGKNDRQHRAAAEVVAAMKADEPGKVATVEAYDAKALELLQSEYAGTPAAATGELLAGISLLRNGGDKAQAINHLENVAAATPNNMLKARALAAIATDYMADGKDEDATKTWQRVAQLPENPYTALAYVCLGDIAKSTGDKEAARAHYEQAKAKCPLSALVRDRVVDLRLSLLDVDAPVPTTPAPAAPAQDGAGNTDWLNQDVSTHSVDTDPAQN